MASRIAAFVGLMLLAAGGLLVAERVSVAQLAAAPPAETKPASVVATPPEKLTKPVAKATLPKRKPAAAQVKTPLPPRKPALTLREKEKGVPAKFLFASKKLPSQGPSQAIGYYPRGCLKGGIELPPNGPHWEAMRLSRNRNWGHPSLVRFLKDFSAEVAKQAGWPGILVGDMAQPRGGPLPFGHRSHQIGLDVDVWYKPMPDRILTKKEREKISAPSLVAKNGLEVNKLFTAGTAAFIRIAAQQPEVERVLVNAAIKKEMCKLEGKHHYAWMSKLRPWYGHDDHIHVRLKCPAGSPHCRHQPPVPSGDGCSKKALAFWFSHRVLHPKPSKPSKKPSKPRKQIMLANLPAACTTVLNAPAKKTDLAVEGH